MTTHKLTFVVHEHHASRLHYDFRLQVCGVLKSWAIPKGPSMNARDKRLAILVEDHPLEYGTFEGIIPEGRYGAGAVVIWDAGSFKPLEEPNGALKKGRLAFVLDGKRLRGEFALVRLKGKSKEWLLLKRKDAYADPTWRLESALTTARRKALKEHVPPCEAS
jgi:bifunctional non-homologous end joining protein LigD